MVNLLSSPTMQDPTEVPLSAAGEISDVTSEQVAEGQPVLLLRNGRPAAVIVDLESWEEAELAAIQPA
jgi:PHD/YefM family antitoxin component YafN of YafNO toxin-antitoxin module